MTDGSEQDLLARARAWMADDPDPATRAALAEAVEARDLAALAEAFAGPLEFGTAGLRGKLGPGPARMNEATVARAAAGLARQLLADVPGAAARGVVVGRDARRGSPELARVAAEVLAGHGVTVRWMEGPNPTPLVAFAGRHLRAAGTAIVTASHNPPEYNGFKVYSPRGAQIVPPQDARIRAEGDAAGPVRDLPRAPFAEAEAAGRIRRVDAAVAEAYLAALDGQCLGPVPPPARVRAVTTALHGVGHRLVEAALRRRGHDDLHPVAEQAEPDGAFPTVAFPNPEEPGALDLAMARARAVRADVVLANDPDTDRLCVAARGAEGWRVLTGNELGVLLADWRLGEGARLRRLPARPLVVTTLVSTTMLERVAAAHGAAYAETLTGFKWIWDRALALEAAEGASFVFGFEEALGYCVGPAVRDKDGVGAAQVLMELAAALKAKERTLLDRLDDLAVQHGLHATRQVAVVMPGLEGRERMAGVLADLRARPPAAPGGEALARARDLLGPDAEAAGLPPADVLTWWTEGGARVVLRPSGTEPKLKAYLEVREAAPDRAGLAGARARAEARLEALEAWIRGRMDAG